MPSPLHKHGTHVNELVSLPAFNERKGWGFNVNTIHTSYISMHLGMPDDKHSAPCRRILVLGVAFINCTSTTFYTPVNTFIAVHTPCHGHPAISSIHRSLQPLCNTHYPTLKDQVCPLAIHNIIHIACAPHMTHTQSLPQHPRIPLPIIHRLCTFPLTSVHLEVCTCTLPPTAPLLLACHPHYCSCALCPEKLFSRCATGCALSIRCLVAPFLGILRPTQVGCMQPSIRWPTVSAHATPLISVFASHHRHCQSPVDIGQSYPCPAH